MKRKLTIIAAWVLIASVTITLAWFILFVALNFK